MLRDLTQESILQGIVVYCPLHLSFRRFRKKDKKNPYRHGFGYEAAKLRVVEGKKSPISEAGFITEEGAIYFADGDERILTRNSPILDSEESARAAVEAHQNLEELYLDDEQIGRAQEDSVRLPTENIEIPFLRFGEEELTVWYYGKGDSKKARDYGNFLSSLGEGEGKMLVWVPSPAYIRAKNFPCKERAFVRQYRIGSVLVGSRMGGYFFGISGNQAIFGARYVSPVEITRAQESMFGRAIKPLKNFFDKI